MCFSLIYLFLSADLSSYIPKHSVDFSAWQEHKHDDGINQEDAASQQTQRTEEVMVRETPSAAILTYITSIDQLKVFDLQIYETEKSSIFYIHESWYVAIL